MSRQNDVAPIIIKRKKIIKKGGHHGGAWKVAYADFVTAMMAFFLMMWLLGATTESQRRGLADYFNPTIPVHRISSGGDGMFGGTDLETRAQQGPASPAEEEIEAEVAGAAEAQTFDDLEQQLNGMGGESPVLDDALRHIVTRQTDEGLVLEVFDLPGVPLFEADTDTPTAITQRIVGVLAHVFNIVINPLAIEGHTRTYTVVHANDPRWTLSSSRADRVRLMLGEAGFDPARVARVTGHADRQPSAENPMAVRNNRLELILLRRHTGED